MIKSLTRYGALVLLLIMFPSAVVAADGVWKRWFDELHRECPARHVDWICDGCYDEYMGGFSKTLSVSTNRKLDRVASYSRRCRNEIGGFSCEMYVYLDAVERFGLLKQFTAFGCKTYRCEDVTICTSTLSPPTP